MTDSDDSDEYITLSYRKDSVKMKKLSYTKIYQKIKDCIVHVHDTNQTYNGYIIKKSYILVSNISNPKSNFWVNLNISKKSYIYEAELIGFDPNLNLALLYLNMDLNWNQGLNNYHIKGLNWGHTHDCRLGDPVYTIGYTEGLQFDKGRIQNNQWIDLTGRYVFEGILISNGIKGSPLINKYGEVIGILQEHNIGISESVIQDSIYQLIKIHKRKISPSKWTLIDNYYIHNKGYIGISYTFKAPIHNLQNFKQSKGLFITGIDGISFNSSSGPSPLIDILNVDDLITDFSYTLSGNPLEPIKKSIGIIPPQVAPSTITFNLVAGKDLTIHYRKKDEKYANEHSITVKLKSYPPEVNKVI